MKIFFSNSAYSDLDSIKVYYEEEGVPHIGRQFVISIIDHIQILNDYPDIGRIVPELGEEKMYLVKNPQKHQQSNKFKPYRGVATVKMTTNEIMVLTRGDEWVVFWLILMSGFIVKIDKRQGQDRCSFPVLGEILILQLKNQAPQPTF